MKIIDYRPDLAIHFEQINRVWIEKYFKVEPIDEQVITNPEKEIIDKGGAVLFAVQCGGSFTYYWNWIHHSKLHKRESLD
ncbi:MAG: hypothetical protein RIF34_00350 [Candidatus Kapaibacterium sp.]